MRKRKKFRIEEDPFPLHGKRIRLFPLLRKNVFVELCTAREL
jgi:hypothetical protein